MAYTKTIWTSSTPINTTNLNNIENGIAELFENGTGSGGSETGGVSLPVGTIVEYDGETIPEGFEELGNDITVEKRILWENPDPTIPFEAQVITLSSEDYDSLLVYYKETSNPNITTGYGVEILKGHGTRLTCMFLPDDVKLCVYSRNMARLSDAEFSFDDAYYYYAAKNEKGKLNMVVVPFAIYGIKHSRDIKKISVIPSGE